MENDFIYPLVAFGKDGSIHFARNDSEITTCSPRALKSGYYNDLFIVDSAGKQYLIVGASKIGTVGSFFDFGFRGGRKPKVALTIDQAQNGVFPLDELKNKILDVFKKDPYFYNSDGEVENKKKFIHDAASHREVISSMTDSFYRHYK